MFYYYIMLFNFFLFSINSMQETKEVTIEEFAKRFKQINKDFNDNKQEKRFQKVYAQLKNAGLHHVFFDMKNILTSLVHEISHLLGRPKQAVSFSITVGCFSNACSCDGGLYQLDDIRRYFCSHVINIFSTIMGHASALALKESSFENINSIFKGVINKTYDIKDYSQEKYMQAFEQNAVPFDKLNQQKKNEAEEGKGKNEKEKNDEKPQENFWKSFFDSSNNNGSLQNFRKNLYSYLFEERPKHQGGITPGINEGNDIFNAISSCINILLVRYSQEKNIYYSEKFYEDIELLAIKMFYDILNYNIELCKKYDKSGLYSDFVLKFMNDILSLYPQSQLKTQNNFIFDSNKRLATFKIRDNNGQVIEPTGKNFYDLIQKAQLQEPCLQAYAHLYNYMLIDKGTDQKMFIGDVPFEQFVKNFSIEKYKFLVENYKKFLLNSQNDVQGAPANVLAKKFNEEKKAAFIDRGILLLYFNNNNNNISSQGVLSLLNKYKNKTELDKMGLDLNNLVEYLTKNFNEKRNLNLNQYFLNLDFKLYAKEVGFVSQNKKGYIIEQLDGNPLIAQLLQKLKHQINYFSSNMNIPDEAFCTKKLDEFMEKYARSLSLCIKGLGVKGRERFSSFVDVEDLSTIMLRIKQKATLDENEKNFLNIALVSEDEKIKINLLISQFEEINKTFEKIKKGVTGKNLLLNYLASRSKNQQGIAGGLFSIILPLDQQMQK